jgi:hypothetical protein
MNKMATITTYFTILTLKVDGLKSPIKRHREVGWIKKQAQSFVA